jgi:FMN phosphatase YigB (HAD superfamily)
MSSDALFEARVDGNMMHAQNLAGKPAPDTYLAAAKLLGVEPARSIVIEDAIVGVEAGHTGKFGLVVGVARKGNAEELRWRAGGGERSRRIGRLTNALRCLEEQPMLHHERQRPPPTDYPADEWNVIEKNFTWNS